MILVLRWFRAKSVRTVMTKSCTRIVFNDNENVLPMVSQTRGYEICNVVNGHIILMHTKPAMLCRKFACPWWKDPIRPPNPDVSPFHIGEVCGIVNLVNIFYIVCVVYWFFIASFHSFIGRSALSWIETYATWGLESLCLNAAAKRNYWISNS